MRILNKANLLQNENGGGKKTKHLHIEFIVTSHNSLLHGLVTSIRFENVPSGLLLVSSAAVPH